jgi:hypothetical protein
VPLLHESFVQPLLSLQLGAAPPTHAPPAHVSAVVHMLLSLHAAVLLAFTQPVTGSHESLVQPLVSAQSSGWKIQIFAPRSHVPANAHASGGV